MQPVKGKLFIFAGLFGSKYAWCFYGTHLYPQPVLSDFLKPTFQSNETDQQKKDANYFKRKWISCLEMKNCIQVYLHWIPIRYGRLSIYDWNKEKNQTKPNKNKNKNNNLPHLYFNLAVRYQWISNLIRIDESCECGYIMITIISKENNPFLRWRECRKLEVVGQIQHIFTAAILGESRFLETYFLSILSWSLFMGCPNNCPLKQGRDKEQGCLGQDRDGEITFQSPSLISGKND